MFKRNDFTECTAHKLSLIVVLHRIAMKKKDKKNLNEETEEKYFNFYYYLNFEVLNSFKKIKV